MFTSSIKKLVTILTLLVFLAVDFHWSVFGFIETTQAALAVKAQEAQTTAPDLKITDEEYFPVQESEAEEEDIDPEAESEIPHEVLAAATAIDSIFQKSKIAFDPNPKIILHPFDQTLLEFRLDPEQAGRRLAEPGTDKAAFDEATEKLFGFALSLDQQPTVEHARELIISILKNKQQTEDFIKTLTNYSAAQAPGVQDSQFATTANEVNLEIMIKTAQEVEDGRPKRENYESDQDFVEANLNFETTIITKAKIIAEQFIKMFEFSETFSPIIYSITGIAFPLPLDRRVVKTLIYLVTPRDQGGAGHERIKLERIWKDYSEPDENDEDNIDKEWKDADNISRHRFGQAIDISEIDNVKCTLMKRGWVRKKIVLRPPIPVKVAFQTPESLARTAEGGSNLPLGFTMAEVFRDLAIGNLLDGISDLDLEDLEEGSLKDATLNDILIAVGEQMVAKALGLGGSGGFKGSDFTSIITQVGQAMLADKLGLPRYAIRGDFDDMEANIGRAALEQRLGLAPESLQGNNRDQILQSVGARKLEKIMQLRRKSLSFGGQAVVSRETLLTAVGQGYIEETLRLKPGTFAGSGTNQIRQAMGDYRWQYTFAQNPHAVDNTLKIGSGTTDQFVSGGDRAAHDFKVAVGRRVLDDNFKVFSNYQEDALARIEDIRGLSADDQFKAILQTKKEGTQEIRDDRLAISQIDEILKIIELLYYGPQQQQLPGQPRVPQNRQIRFNITGPEVQDAATQIKDQLESLKTQYTEKINANSQAKKTVERIGDGLEELLREPIPENRIRVVNRGDQAFGVPRGTIEQFLNGKVGLLREIGGYELSARLTSSDQERRLVYDWFTKPNIELGPVESQVSAAMGVSVEDFKRIFDPATSSNEVFKTVGERRLYKAVRNLPEVKRFEQQYLNELQQSNPELFNLINDIDFRLDRLRDMRRDIDRLERLAGASTETREIKQIIDRALRNPDPIGAVNAARQISRAWDRLDKAQQGQVTEEVRTIMDRVRRNFRAVIEGEYPRSATELGKNDLVGDRQTKGRSPNISIEDLLDLISKRKTPQDVVLTIGLRRVEYALDLPAESLFFFSKEQTKSPEAFFTSIGKAKVQERYGRLSLDQILDRFGSRMDRDLHLREGTTRALSGQTSGQTAATQDAQLYNAYITGFSSGRVDADINNTPPGQRGPSFSQQAARDRATGSQYARGYDDGVTGISRPPQSSSDQSQQNYVRGFSDGNADRTLIEAGSQPSGPRESGASYRKGYDDGRQGSFNPSGGQQVVVTISQQRYYEIVGRQTLIFGAIRRMTGDIRIDGLAFTPEDVYFIATGGGQNTFARVAGYKLDQKLGLFPGSAERIIAARNPQERNDAMAIAGGALIGRYLGIGPIDLRGGDPMLSTGATIIENTLGFKEGSVRKSKNLEELEAADPKTPAKLFGESADDLKRTDRLLGLTPGTTQKLQNGEISLGKYKELVGRDVLQTQLLQSDRVIGFILGAMGIEQESEMGQKLRTYVFGNFGIVDIMLRNSGKTLNQWHPNDKFSIFNSLEGLFGFEFDRRARMRPGTFAEIFAHPDQARQIIMREGIYTLDQQLNLGGKLQTAYNFYTLSKEKKEERQAQRTVQLNHAANSFYETGYRDGQRLIRDHRPTVVTDPETGEEIDVDRSDLETARSDYFNPPSTNDQFKQAYDKGFNDATSGMPLQTRAPEATSVANNAPAPGEEGRFKRSRQGAIERAEREAISQIQQFVFNEFKVSLSDRDILGIARGDTRAFQFIAFAEGARRINTFLNGQELPAQYQLRIEDFRLAFQSADSDLPVIDKAGELAAAQAAAQLQGKDPQLILNIAEFKTDVRFDAGVLDPNNPQDVAFAKTLIVDAEKRAAQRQTAEKLRREYRQNLQYKIFDITAYKFDENIPIGFAKAVFDGTEDMRFDTLLSYLERRANNAGGGFAIPQGSLPALRAYFDDRTQENFDKLLRTGLFRSVEDTLRREEILGRDLPDGTIEGLFRWGVGGDASLLEDLGRRRIFQWADKAFKFPTGTAFQIYSLAKDVITAQRALSLLSGSSVSTSVIGISAGVTGSVGAAAGLSTTTINNATTATANATLTSSQQLIQTGTTGAQAANTLANAGSGATQTSLSTTPGLSLSTSKQISSGVQNGLSLDLSKGTTEAFAFTGPQAQQAAREAAKRVAQQRLNAAKAALVSFVVTTVFSKQLAKADQALGLVTGSTSIIISHMISIAFNPALAANPVAWGIMIGMFLLINLFGFTKIRLQCTADGYYPFRRDQTFDPDLYLGLGEFNGMNPEQYRQGLLQAGQGRVQGLIEDILNMPYHFDEQGNNLGVEVAEQASEKMKPAQIYTKRKEDFEAFFGSDLYAQVFNEDPPGPGNLQGILTGSDFFVENWVHVGF